MGYTKKQLERYGAQFKIHRENRRLSQQVVAESTGVPQKAVSLFENGGGRVYISRLLEQLREWESEGERSINTLAFVNPWAGAIDQLEELIEDLRGHALDDVRKRARWSKFIRHHAGMLDALGVQEGHEDREGIEDITVTNEN